MMPATKLGMLKRCWLRIRLSVSSLALAGLLIPAAAHAQVTYTGTAATQNFGSQAIGSPSAAKTFNFSITVGATVGSIAVVTQGAPNLDFNSATGSTCTATTYASTTTCTVNVTFKPIAAGARMGAVVFFSEAGNKGTVLGSVLVHGTGTGSQIAYGPGTSIAIDPTVNGEGFDAPDGIAVDGAGDLFVVDQDHARIVEVPADGGAATAFDPEANGSGLYLPYGLSMDSIGDLFIGDFGNNRIVEMPAGGGAPTVIDPKVSLSGPLGAVVDGAGNLFIADTGNSRVVELPAGGGAATAIDPTVNGKSLYLPCGLAVDGMGDLFIADFLNSRVVEVPPGGGAPTAIDPTVNGEGLDSPSGLAMDGVGDLFITDYGNSRVVEIPANGGTPIAIDPSVNGETLGFPFDSAVDAAGDLFITDRGRSRVIEVQHSQPPTLNFPTLTVVGTIDLTDGTQTVQVQNIGNEALTLTALSYPADFSGASGDANACTASTSLSAGQECDLPIEFTPEHGGPLSEDVTLTDNASNVIGVQQSIAVSGKASSSGLTSPAPGSTLTGPSATFMWRAIAGATGYDLWLGTTGVGSNNLWGSGVTTATSATFGGLPTNGETIYARLFTFSSGSSVFADSIYTAASGALLISPASGSILPGPSATFQWTTPTGATSYDLWLGTTGVGSNNLWGSGATTATSITFGGLPTNGEIVYARLFTTLNGSLWHADTMYTATSPSTMTSPTPGSTFAGKSATFQWTSVPGATGYDLWFGTEGVGSNNLVSSGAITATSITFGALPTNGEKIYVRLFTFYNGGSAHTDYVYTAAP